MPSALSSYGGNVAVHALLGVKGLFLALHVDNPTDAGLAVSEVAGGGYRRQPITFSLPGTKTSASTSAQTFTGMPACTVTWIAVWTGISGGNTVYSLQLPTPIVCTASGQVVCAAGDVALTL